MTRASGRASVAARWPWVLVSLASVAVRVASALGAPDTWATVPVLGAFPLLAAGMVLAVLAGAVVGRASGTASLRDPTAALGLCAVVAAGLVLPRTVALEQPSADGPQVVVGLVNARRGSADPARISRLARDADVDVLVVVELSEELAGELAREGLGALLPQRVLAPTGATAGGGVWSRYGMEVLAPPDPAVDTPDVAVDVPGGGQLQVVSTHPLPPIGPARTEAWRDGLARVGPPPDAAAVVAGDLDATWDHATFRALVGDGWRDAAREVGDGLRWTYEGPLAGSVAPPMALDHVLVGPGIAVDAVTVNRVAGTDHRMVVASLRLPARAGD